MNLASNLFSSQPNPNQQIIEGQVLSRHRLSLKRTAKRVQKRNKNLPDILLITDKYWTSQTIVPLLESKYNFFIASMIPDGIDFIEKQSPDLILCDSEQNVENVISVIHESGNQDAPFLLISNSLDRNKYLPLIGHGVTDFLITPFTIEEFQTKIQHYLDVYQTRKILQGLLENSGCSLIDLAEKISQECLELKRLNRANHDFLAVLSHELRNPINVISGFSEILLNEHELSEDAQIAADAIFRNSQIQNKLVADLMDVSRSSFGKMVLDPVSLDLKSLLEETLPALKKSAEKKKIRVQVSIAERPAQLLGDPVRLTQMLWNLFSNALKFTPENGRIDIELRTKNGFIEFAVKDSGVGINPSFLPHIFEEFHQQDESITKNYGGLGLGLAIVRHIVELHGGKVQAESEGVGKGARFTVTLPAHEN